MMDLNSLSEKGRETYLHYCMKGSKKVPLEDVILSEDNTKKVHEFLRERLNVASLRRVGLEPANKLLMYGASGTGKTYLTQAISSRLCMPLLHINVSQFKAEYLSSIINDIFELASELKNAVIFFDECDSICWARDDMNNSDDNIASIRRANNVLFQQLDQMSSDIVFISATNLYDNLDVAFKRRFNIEMKFLAPKIDNFGAVIEKFINPAFKFEQDMDLEVKKIVDYQARNYSRMSYFQIKDWVQCVEKRAIFAQKNSIKESDIYDLLMAAMRIEVKYDASNKPYLHQFGVQTK